MPTSFAYLFKYAMMLGKLLVRPVKFNFISYSCKYAMLLGKLLVKPVLTIQLG